MGLKNVKMLIPPGFRRSLGIGLNVSKKNVYRLPLIGKTLWKRKIDELALRPRQLNIEITSICNAKCIMCPRHLMDRKMEPMPFQMYKKIISEAKASHINVFALNGYGEIFTLKKDYQTYIDHLLEMIPNARIIINTNGSLLNETVAQYLIDKKIDTVHVDIDGASKKTFEKIRENLRFNAVTNNIKRLIEMRNAQGARYPKIRVGMIEQKDNAHEKQQFFEQWRGVADFVHGDLAVSRLGWFDVSRNKMVENPCALPFFEMTLLSNGDVVLCCDDWNGVEPVGNIMKSSLIEVWRNQVLTQFREYHLTGEADKISVCAQCDFARPGPSWFRAHNDFSKKRHDPPANSELKKKGHSPEVAS